MTSFLALFTVLMGTLVPAPQARAVSGNPVNLPFDTRPGDVLVDESREHVFVSSPGASSIAVLDFEGNILKEITGVPGAGAMEMEGSKIYAAAPGAEAVDEIDAVSLSRTDRFTFEGFTNPRHVAFAGERLWVGYCFEGYVGMASFDPSTGGDLKTYVQAGNEYPSYCPAFATSPSDPNLLVTWDSGLNPPTIWSFNVATDPPTLLATRREEGLTSISDGKVTADGSHVLLAHGYGVLEMTSDDLQGTKHYSSLNSSNTIAVSDRGGGYLASGSYEQFQQPEVQLFRLGDNLPIIGYEISQHVSELEFGGDGLLLFAATEFNRLLYILRGAPDSVQIIPEGATHSGFSTFILVSNPTDVEALVGLTLLTTFGPIYPDEAPELFFELSPGQRTTINLNTLLEDQPIESGVIVSSWGAPVVASGTLHKAGSLAAVGIGTATQGSDEWFIAEGATHSGYTTFITIVNPYLVSSRVDVEFLTAHNGVWKGPQDVDVPAGTRVTFSVNASLPKADDVSTKIQAEHGSVVAGMSIHKVEGDLGIGGSLGVPSTSKTWVTAEGATHSGWHTFVLVANPTDELASVRVTFLTGTGSIAGPQNLSVPPKSRVTIDVNAAAGKGHDVSTLVSANVGEVVVESSIQKLDASGFIIADSTAAPGTNVATASASSWLAPEGATHSGFGTFILVANPNVTSASIVNVTFLTPSGPISPSPLQGVVLAGGSRLTIPVNAYVTNSDVSTLVEATSGVVVEMSIDRVTPQGFAKARSLAERVVF